MFGKGLRNTGLSATKSTRDSTSTSSDSWEERVKDSLSSQQGHVTRKFLHDWSWFTDWPVVGHSYLDRLGGSLWVLKLHDGVSDGVVSGFNNAGDSSSDLWWDHDSMRN